MTYTINNENLFSNTVAYELPNTRTSSYDFSELSRWHKAECTCNLEQDQFAALCTNVGRHHKSGITAFFKRAEGRLEDLKWNLNYLKTFAAFESKKA